LHLNNTTRYTMSASMKKQCPNCHGWYGNLKGFKHHLRHCRRSIDTKSSEEVHRLIANPTLSIRSSSDVFAPNRSVLSDEDISYNNEDFIETVDSYKDNNEDNSGFLCCVTQKKLEPFFLEIEYRSNNIF
jgi:hypothetical protein